MLILLPAFCNLLWDFEPVELDVGGGEVLEVLKDGAELGGEVLQQLLVHSLLQILGIQNILYHYPDLPCHIGHFDYLQLHLGALVGGVVGVPLCPHH